MENLTGKQFGQYQLLAPLGQGGMASVYKAYQPSMDRFVAVKILPRQYADDPTFTARFNQEARTLAKLQHPHILPVFDFGESEGYTYLVMPLLQGGTLKEIMTGRPLSLELVNKVIAQIGDALDYAHSRNIVHRDVKPSNILIDERGNCMLADFGIARLLEGTTRLTQSGEALGTPVYMAPEQGQGKAVDARSDIYALGVVLYQMLTGKPPYDAETPAAIIIKHISDPLIPPSALNPSIPESVEAITLKALAKNPDDRFATAALMVKKLQDAVVNELAKKSISEATQQADNAVQQTQKTSKIRLVWSAIALVITALIVIIVLWSLGNTSAKTLLNVPLDSEQGISTTATENGNKVAEQATLPHFAHGDEVKTVQPKEEPTRQMQVTSLDPVIMPTYTATPSLAQLGITNVSNNPGRSVGPEIAVDAQGFTHIVWQDDYNPDERGYYHVAISPDGTWNDPQPLTEGYRYPDYLELIHNTQGQVCATFGAFSSTTRSLNYLTCFEGVPASTPQAITNKSLYNLQIQYSPQGKMEFVFNDTVGGDIYFDSDNNRISDGYKGTFDPHFLIDGKGYYHVLWRSSGNPDNIAHRYSKDDGETWSDIKYVPIEEKFYPKFNVTLNGADEIVLIVETYADDLLFYKWSEDNDWQTYSLNFPKISGGRFINMISDRNGLIHIAWDSSEGIVNYYQLDENTWNQAATIPVEYTDIESIKMAVDQKNKIHLVWNTKKDNNDVYHLVLPE
ncbi:MAG: protein kinase [Anaerolineae bacterium]|nr:protein kinase [Anaerolineae bacterium]